MSEKRLFKNNYINWFFTSKMVDGFFFSVLCATIFTFALCHWLLDLNYKYENVNQQGPIVDLKWVFWIGASVAIYYIIKLQQLQFDFALLILCQTLVLIGVMDYHNENYVPVCYAWILPLAYILGNVIAKDGLRDMALDKSAQDKKIYISYAMLSLGMFLCAVLDYSFILKMDYSEWGWGAWPSFFLSDATYISRTTYDLGFVLVISSSVMVFFLIKKNKLLASILAVMISIPQIFSVKYQARLCTCLFVVCVMIYILIYVFEHGKELKKIILITVIAVCAVLLLLIILFSLNAFGIHDRYLNSYWADDGGIFKNARIQTDWDAFLNIVRYPLDDFQASYGLARGHSMMLEYGRVYDMTIYGLLILFRVLVSVKAFRMLISKKIDIKIKMLLIPAFLSINLYYSIEPNAHAYRYFLMVGLFVFGMISAYI